MGMRGKRGKDKKNTGWIRDTVLRIYTEEQLKEDWEKIGPERRIATIASWVPKQIQQDSSISIKLVIDGLSDRPAIVGKAIDDIPALETGDDAQQDDALLPIPDNKT